MLGAYEGDETVMIIDGRNSYMAGGALGFDLDFLKIDKYLKETTVFLRSHYFTTVDPSRDDGLGNLLHLLDENGFTIFTKEVDEYQDNRGAVRVRGNCNVEIACCMLLAAVNGAQHLVLFSGNSDLAAAVEYAKDQGCRVTVVSTKSGDQNGNPVVAPVLARAADEFIDMQVLREHFWRRDRRPFAAREELGLGRLSEIYVAGDGK